MKQYLTGFFMAWGNFCALPCPCKRWDTNATPLMLGFLPSVGVIIGAIWAVLYFAAVYFGLPYLVVAFLVTFLPFALCGFLHMDGFMDCSDAILSRRPLEDRQRILKDSHTGAFAVISIVFYILAYFAFTSTAITIGIDFANMILLVCLSRSVSGLHVLIAKPMQTSQYVKMQPEADPDETTAADIDEAEKTSHAVSDAVRDSAIAYRTETLLSSADAGEPKPSCCEAAVSFADQIAEETSTHADGETKAEANIEPEAKAESHLAPQIATGTRPATKKQGIVLLLAQLVIYLALAFWCSSYPIVTAIMCAFTVCAVCAAIFYGRRQLGGMNGDIAGYGILWGELFGMLALALF